MAEPTREVLQRLREMIISARAVPMSASCMVNRKEALALLARAEEVLGVELHESERLAANSLETRERANAEAAAILAEAREQARQIVAQDRITQDARALAAEILDTSKSEAEALRREADAYVDMRMASFEAGLTKTMTQVRTMRERLSSRSALDDLETQALPRISG